MYVGPYDGRIGDIPSAQIDWVDTQHQEVDDWKPGESRQLRFTVRSRNLPHEGTYVLKLLITEWLPLGTPDEEEMQALEEGDMPPATKHALMQSSRETWKRMGIDPHKPQTSGFKGNGIHTIYIVDYFRVEPMSSVLTFGVVVATLLLALATLGVVIATLVH